MAAHLSGALALRPLVGASAEGFQVNLMVEESTTVAFELHAGRSCRACTKPMVVSHCIAS